MNFELSGTIEIPGSKWLRNYWSRRTILHIKFEFKSHWKLRFYWNFTTVREGYNKKFWNRNNKRWISWLKKERDKERYLKTDKENYFIWELKQFKIKLVFKTSAQCIEEVPWDDKFSLFYTFRLMYSEKKALHDFIKNSNKYISHILWFFSFGFIVMALSKLHSTS